MRLGLARWRRAIEEEPPRPYVAFAAVDARHARRLYRAQNVVWVWLGLAALLSAIAYAFRPSLGPVLVTHSRPLDLVRVFFFATGGLLISTGVWWVRRELEVVGHVLFATGAVLTALATLTVPGPKALTVATTLGVAFASGFRVYFIVEWIGSGRASRR